MLESELDLTEMIMSVKSVKEVRRLDGYYRIESEAVKRLHRL